MHLWGKAVDFLLLIIPVFGVSAYITGLSCVSRIGMQAFSFELDDRYVGLILPLCIKMGSKCRTLTLL